MSTTPNNRTAKLTVQEVLSSSDQTYISFRASNGETLGVGETHPSHAAGEQSREAWLRAMVEVLESEGYIVTRAENPYRKPTATLTNTDDREVEHGIGDE